MADTDYLAASDGTGNAALMHITSPRTALATIIQVDTVTGVPAFFIGTWGTLGSDGFITAASARDFFGHVNAGTLVIDKMAPGNTDAGNTTGQVVVIKPSTPAANLIGNFVKTALSNFGEGQLLNGQIVPSISSNNLVVAVKTLNNVDPSTTDVVYVRIGNAIRTITAPLSVTLAAGTNWFSKGNTPYAATATDYFAYIGWNATDGVVLGVSSTMGANYYNDFSVTNTDWTYAKISNIAHAAATDKYNVVARFNAILGVTATFLWTLPAGAAQTITNEVIGTPSVLFGQGIWWQELSRATLQTAAATLATATFTPKKYMQLRIYVKNAGAAQSPWIRFNGDGGTNYALRYEANYSAGTALASQVGLSLNAASIITDLLAIVDIINNASTEKPISITALDIATAGAANVPNVLTSIGKWANTASQITSVSLFQSGVANNFAAGTEIVVLGHD